MFWTRGENVSALPRGPNNLDFLSLQLIGNLITNFQKTPPALLIQLHEVLVGPRKRTSIDPLIVLSSFSGVNVKTLRGWKGNLDDRVSDLMKQRSAKGQSRQPLAAASVIPESLPECLLPGVEDIANDAEDDDLYLDVEPVHKPKSKWESWQFHPAFAKGIRLAEIATMWHVSGWSKNQYGNFMAL